MVEEPNRRKKPAQLHIQNLKILKGRLQDGNGNKCLIERLSSAEEAVRQC